MGSYLTCVTCMGVGSKPLYFPWPPRLAFPPHPSTLGGHCGHFLFNLLKTVYNMCGGLKCFFIVLAGNLIFPLFDPEFGGTTVITDKGTVLVIKSEHEAHNKGGQKVYFCMLCY